MCAFMEYYISLELTCTVIVEILHVDFCYLDGCMGVVYKEIWIWKWFYSCYILVLFWKETIGLVNIVMIYKNCSHAKISTFLVIRKGYCFSCLLDILWNSSTVLIFACNFLPQWFEHAAYSNYYSIFLLVVLNYLLKRKWNLCVVLVFSPFTDNLWVMIFICNLKYMCQSLYKWM